MSADNTHEKPKHCEIIAALMQNNNESTTKLAAAIGVSGNILKNWIRNRTPIDYDGIIKIAEHYGVSTDYLLGLTDPEHASPNPDIQNSAAYTYLSDAALLRLHLLGEIGGAGKNKAMSMLSEFIAADGFDEIYDSFDGYRELSSALLSQMKRAKELYKEIEHIPLEELQKPQIDQLKKQLDKLYGIYQKMRLNRFEAAEVFTESFDRVVNHEAIEMDFITSTEPIRRILWHSLTGGAPTFEVKEIEELKRRKR